MTDEQRKHWLAACDSMIHKLKTTPPGQPIRVDIDELRVTVAATEDRPKEVEARR